MTAAQPRLVAFGGEGPPKGASKHRHPTAADQARITAMERLLALEAEMREARDVEALILLLAHEAKSLIDARHSFVLRPAAFGKFRVVAASHLTEIDPDAPVIRLIEKRVADIAAVGPEWLATHFSLVGEGDAQNGAPPYAYLQALGAVLHDAAGDTCAVVVHTRAHPWIERELLIAKRLADCAAHAWRALQPRPRRFAVFAERKRLWFMLAAALIFLASFIPVPLTVLAPGRIAALDPFVVAAPLDGVIEEILVDPNTAVSEGAPLIRYVETTLRNKLLVAESEVGVAESKLRRVTQSSFTNADAKRELAVAESELRVKRAERDFAAETLARARVMAPRAGIVIYADRKDWAGKPVTVGERVLDIADPNKVEIVVDLPVEDAIDLPDRARVRLFLDGDPLNPVHGEVVRLAHEPRLIENRFMAFPLTARLIDTTNTPRLGARGTAQIIGRETTLFYFLFRRPIRAFRHWTGI